MFEYENGDKFCAETVSYLDLGWEWTQDNQDLSITNAQGYIKLDLAYYLKFYLTSTFILKLQRFMLTELQI